MSELQHSEARRLLPILSRVAETSDILTYQSAARALGRDPKTNARTVAQMCDLLDAAAVLAGVPLLALFYVREVSLAVNRKALENFEWSDAIVEKSRRHTFTVYDIEAIRLSLDELRGMGNVKAWAFVHRMLSREELYRRLAQPETANNTDVIEDRGLDAINDLGSDAPVRMTTSVQRYARDPEIRAAVLLRAGGKCEFCGRLGFFREDGSRYLEGHHIIALADDGADRMTNVIALCPNDHRKAHFDSNRAELERQMTLIVQKSGS